MKHISLLVLLFPLFIQAQNNDFTIQKGGYLETEIGGVGIPYATFTYKYIQPNKAGFYSFEAGFNFAHWIWSHNLGIPHGASIHLGKKRLFLELGINNWLGYYSHDEDPSISYQGYTYLLGGNLGLNFRFQIQGGDAYLSANFYPQFNLNGIYYPEYFYWAGLSFAGRLH